MYRVGIITEQGNILGKTVKTRQDAEDYILTIAEQEGVKRADIVNKTTGTREKITEGLK